SAGGGLLRRHSHGLALTGSGSATAGGPGLAGPAALGQARGRHGWPDRRRAGGSVPGPGATAVPIPRGLHRLVRGSARLASARSRGVSEGEAWSGCAVPPAAQPLGMVALRPWASALNRDVRALERLEGVLPGMPGGIEGIWR